MLISLIHATRGRPERCLEVRQEWLDKSTTPDLVEHTFAVDADDPESIDAAQPFRRVIVLPPRGCFRAYNHAAIVSTGEMIIPIEDDLHPDVGWDDLVREAMGPHMEQPALLAVTDGQNTCIEWAANRRFYEARGRYNDDYYGLFGDTELRLREGHAQVNARRRAGRPVPLALRVLDSQYRRGREAAAAEEVPAA